MKKVDCCYNCKFHIEGDCNDNEQCGYCHKGEVFCVREKKTEVNPNNICEHWEKEEWVLP